MVVPRVDSNSEELRYNGLSTFIIIYIFIILLKKKIILQKKIIII